RPPSASTARTRCYRRTSMTSSSKRGDPDGGRGSSRRRSLPGREAAQRIETAPDSVRGREPSLGEVEGRQLTDTTHGTHDQHGLIASDSRYVTRSDAVDRQRDAAGPGVSRVLWGSTN